MVPAGPTENGCRVALSLGARVQDEAFFGNVELATVRPVLGACEVSGRVFRWDGDGAAAAEFDWRRVVLASIFKPLQSPSFLPRRPFAQTRFPVAIGWQERHCFKRQQALQAGRGVDVSLALP